MTNEPTARRAGPMNIYVDKALWTEFKVMCARRRGVRSPSELIGRLMERELRQHGSKYGATLPAHLAEKV